jgi:hypothetical protein
MRHRLASLLLATTLAACSAATDDDGGGDDLGKADDLAGGGVGVESTALAMYLSVHPKAELTAESTRAAVDKIAVELTMLFAEVVQPDAAAGFYLPTPWELGKVVFRPQPAFEATLRALLDGEETLDLASVATGDAAFDALVDGFGATALTAQGFDWYSMTFDPSHNPEIVGDAFSGLSGTIEWAVPNHYFGFGGRRLEWLAQWSPSVYVLEVGWGDCQAGCISRNRTYVEVYGSDYLQPDVELIGRTGDELPADELADLYRY